MENVILASLPFNHERLLLLLLLSRLKEEILFLKILNVMLKCRTEYPRAVASMRQDEAVASS